MVTAKSDATMVRVTGGILLLRRAIRAQKATDHSEMSEVRLASGQQCAVNDRNHVQGHLP